MRATALRAPVTGHVRCHVTQPTFYWRLFNFLARRVVAVGFMIVGSILCLYFLPSLIDPKGTIPVNGIPESDIVYRLFAVVLPAIVAGLGLLLYRVRPWYPGSGSSDT
jgi:hypothetical protein